MIITFLVSVRQSLYFTVANLSHDCFPCSCSLLCKKPIEHATAVAAGLSTYLPGHVCVCALLCFASLIFHENRNRSETSVREKES